MAGEFFILIMRHTWPRKEWTVVQFTWLTKKQQLALSFFRGRARGNSTRSDSWSGVLRTGLLAGEQASRTLQFPLLLPNKEKCPTEWDTFLWSGQRELNPRLAHPKGVYYHYTMARVVLIVAN